MQPEDIPTIDEILTDFGVDDMLGPGSYARLVDALAEREQGLRQDAEIQAANAKATLAKIRALVTQMKTW